MNTKNILIGGVSAFAVTLSAVAPAFAATVVVTPSNTQGWSTADTRPGGAVNFVADATSPYPGAALQLTTDATTTAKAQYLKEVNIALADVTELSYNTKQISGPVHADASYQLLVDLNGAAAGGFTTLVYEPYQNGTVLPAVWQEWDVDLLNSNLWSSRSFSEGTCTVVAGGGGAPFYNLPTLQTVCPDAQVVGFGVNIGSNNSSYNVLVDGVSLNQTIYNFEQDKVLTAKDECKDGGWMSFFLNMFKNQGDCVSSFNHLN